MHKIKGEDLNTHIQKKVADFCWRKMRLTAIVTTPIFQALFLAPDTSQVTYCSPGFQEVGTNIVSMMHKRKLKQKDTEFLAQCHRSTRTKNKVGTRKVWYRTFLLITASHGITCAHL